MINDYIIYSDSLYRARYCVDYFYKPLVFINFLYYHAIMQVNACWHPVLWRTENKAEIWVLAYGTAKHFFLSDFNWSEIYSWNISKFHFSDHKFHEIFQKNKFHEILQHNSGASRIHKLFNNCLFTTPNCWCGVHGIVGSYFFDATVNSERYWEMLKTFTFPSWQL